MSKNRQTQFFPSDLTDIKWQWWWTLWRRNMGLGEPRPGKFVRVSEAREQFWGCPNWIKIWKKYAAVTLWRRDGCMRVLERRNSKCPAAGAQGATTNTRPWNTRVFGAVVLGVLRSVKEDEVGEMHWGQAEPQMAFRKFVLFIPRAVGNDCWRRHGIMINVLNIDEPL